LLANGRVHFGDGHTEASPETFSIGARPLSAGDVIELSVIVDPTITTIGDLVGVDLTINATTGAAVSEPSTVALLGTGLIALVLVGRRRSSDRIVRGALA
jgi:hypothetical protein